MPLSLALATPRDVTGMLAIYAPIVRDTGISWEVEPPTLEDFAGRLEHTLSRGFPWLVARDGDQVAGYAYAHPFRERHAYRFCCECSIYLHDAHRGRGLGARLYGALFEILRRQGYVSVIAGVALPNDASLKLHERLGFARVGTFEGIGFKHERWLDATFLQKELAPRTATPAATAGAPTPFRALLDAGALVDVLDA